MGLTEGIQAGGQIVTSLINSIFAKRNTDLQNKANRELADYQYSKDLEMWNKGNVYNSPMEQMKRLKEAGLNPNMVYGGGGATNTATTLPKYSAPTMQYNYKPPVDPLQMLGAFQDFRIGNAQVDNLKKQNEILQEDAITKRLQNIYLGDTLGDRTQQQAFKTKKDNYGAAYMHNKNDLLAETLGHQIDYVKTKNRKQQMEMENIASSTRLKGLQADMFDWQAWSRILTSFGIKLPSFRQGGNVKPYTGSKRYK